MPTIVKAPVGRHAHTGDWAAALLEPLRACFYIWDLLWWEIAYLETKRLPVGAAGRERAMQ